MTDQRDRSVSRSRDDRLLQLAGHLTDRDHYILSLLRTHRVLTTPQIAQAAFTSHSRATQRLRVLAALGVVARFRPRLDRGSAPWHYVLDVYGAQALAAGSEGRDDRARLRRDRQLAVAHSAHLSHRVGANGFFTSLISAARTSRGAAHLDEWLNAQQAAEWVEAHCLQWGAELPQPDGYGRWRDSGKEMVLFLEWDAGTETHRQLAAKLTRYVAFADNAERSAPWVLFVFPTARRETHARSALRRVSGVDRLPVATAHLPGAQHPAGAVWWPLSETTDRVQLSELPAVVA